MSDTAYENAIKRRDQIIAEIKDAEARVASLRSEWERTERFIDQWHEFAGTPLMDRVPTLVLKPVVAQASGKSGGSAVGRAVRNSKKEDVAEAARKIIEVEGRPMSRTELYNRLIAMGLTIKGADPEMVLSTMLWRMKEKVVRLDKGGYWLTGVPYGDYTGNTVMDDLMGSVDDTPPENVTADDDADE